MPLEPSDIVPISSGTSLSSLSGSESIPALSGTSFVRFTPSVLATFVQQNLSLASYVAVADIDDTPVNGQTNAPISSNWAFDHNAATVAHGATGAVVGTTNTQTLTNKTISGDSNTVQNLSSTAVTHYSHRTVTGSGNVLLTDVGKTVYVSSSSPVILTLSKEASIAWPTDASIAIVNKGAGDVSIACQDNTVTLNGVAASQWKVSLANLHSVLHKTGSNVWSFTNSEQVSATPFITEMTIDESGELLSIYGSDPLANTTGFTLTVGGEEYTLSTPVVEDGVIKFATPTIYEGQSVSVSYAPGNVISADTGTALPSFSATTVQNLSTRIASDVYSVIDIGDWELLNGATAPTETNIVFPGSAANEQLRPDSSSYINVADGEFWNIEFSLRDNDGGGATVVLQFQENVQFITLLERTVTLSGDFEVYTLRGVINTTNPTEQAFIRIRNGETVAKDIEVNLVRVWKDEAGGGGDPVTTYYYLEDQPPNNVSRTLTIPMANADFPIVGTGSLKATPSADQLSCFDIVNAKIFSDNTIAAAQAISSDLTFIRILCPQEYQGWNDAAGKTGNGMPFDATGATTEITGGQGVMFAGHWLYKPRTTLSANINDSVLSFSVASVANLTPGQYICIHNGSFGNAEFMRIQSISGTTVTVYARGYKSTAQSHSSGNHVAMLQLGNGGGDARNWVYNLSQDCPTDGAGNTIAEYLATFYADIYDKDANGNAASSTVHGILYDSDFYQFIKGGNVATRSCDVDNNGAPDGGMTSDGSNSWGLGLVGFYEGNRATLDARGGSHLNSCLWIGDAHTFGLDSCCMGQFEGFPFHVYSASGTDSPSHNYYSEYISWVKANAHGTIGPIIGDLQNKVRTKSYYAGSTAPANDSTHRLCTALACIFGQSVSHMNSYAGVFHWFDDYAVCTATDDGTYSYGEAIPPSDTAKIRTYKGWLGQPTGNFQRVYDTAFAAGNALWTNECESLAGISAFGGASVATNSTNPAEGSRCLRVTTGTPSDYASNSTGITINGIQLTQGQEYTLTFSTRAAVEREFILTIGGATENRFAIPRGDEWMRQVFGFRAGAGGSNISIFSGGDGERFDLDDFKLFAGNANVFKREFDNGIVVANCTRSAVTIDLGGTYNKIDGTQDRTMNDGTTGLTSITLPALDAALLIKPAA